MGGVELAELAAAAVLIVALVVRAYRRPPGYRLTFRVDVERAGYVRPMSTPTEPDFPPEPDDPDNPQPDDE